MEDVGGNMSNCGDEVRGGLFIETRGIMGLVMMKILPAGIVVGS